MKMAALLGVVAAGLGLMTGCETAPVGEYSSHSYREIRGGGANTVISRDSVYTGVGPAVAPSIAAPPVMEPPIMESDDYTRW